MLRAILRNAGIRPDRLILAIRDWPCFVRERSAFRRLPGADDMPWGRELPILGERNESSGSLGGYFHQDLTVARWIHEAEPRRHVDVGSRLDGFIGSLAVFREVEVIDIRPQTRLVRNVRFHQLDLMAELPAEWLHCTDSLSCLHTIEHFGLGRYGDEIDPAGHLKGIERLQAMVAPGGTLYLSTQVGHERIEFNAHRVFAPATVLSWFSGEWEIERCAVIDDACQVSEGEGSGLLMQTECRTGVGIVAARKRG
jgi:hypothetical protein